MQRKQQDKEARKREKEERKRQEKQERRQAKAAAPGEPAAEAGGGDPAGVVQQQTAWQEGIGLAGRGRLEEDDDNGLLSSLLL